MNVGLVPLKTLINNELARKATTWSMRETRGGRHRGKVSPWSADDTYIGSRTNHLNQSVARNLPSVSIFAAKWQTALCKTRLFAGQTGNARAKNTFAALIGCRDVKQLRSANEILRFYFNTRVGANFWKKVFTCSLCSSVLNAWRLEILFKNGRSLKFSAFF